MLKFYYSGAPNPTKVALMLEETGLPYEPIPVDTRKGDQHKPDFLKINPNAKVPAIVDGDATVFDSSACLLYLGEKTGKFLPAKTDKARGELFSWMFFVSSGVGPYSGQSVHFRVYAPEKIEYAMNRYKNEANRLYGVVNKRLGESKYLACDEYTIADMATVPWLRAPERQGVNIDEYPALKKWRDAILERPAVQRAVQVLAERRRPQMTDEQRKNLFGDAQYAKR